MTSRRQQPQQLFTGTTGHGATTGDDSRSMSGSILPIHQRQKRKTSYVASDLSGSTATGSSSVWSPANNNNNINSSSHPAPPPRSGTANFVPDLLELINVRDKTDATAKRRFQVRVPSRLLVVLAMVFLIVPLVIFWHKEVHIHDDHDEAHFKARKYVNVNTQDVMAEFGKHVHNHDDSDNDSGDSEDQVHQEQPSDLQGGNAAEVGIRKKVGTTTEGNPGSSDGVVLEEEDATATKTKNLTTAEYLAQKDESKAISVKDSDATTEDENSKNTKSISSTTAATTSLATNTTEEEMLSLQHNFMHQSTTNTTTRRRRQRRRGAQQEFDALRMR